MRFSSQSDRSRAIDPVWPFSIRPSDSLRVSDVMPATSWTPIWWHLSVTKLHHTKAHKAWRLFSATAELSFNSRGDQSDHSVFAVPKRATKLDGVPRPFVYCSCAAKYRIGMPRKSMYLQCFVRFSNVYKNASDVIAFSNPYLVKSVNLAFAFFLPVYRDVALASFRSRRSRLISSKWSRLGLDQSRLEKKKTQPMAVR